MFSLEDLKAEFAPMEELSHVEKEVKVENMTIVIGLVDPDDEVKVMAKAEEVFEAFGEEDKSSSTVTAHFDVFRKQTLSYAIKSVNGKVIPNKVATGKYLSNGTEILSSKNEALMEIINTWSRAVIQQLFAKYGEVIREAEYKATDAIQPDPLNLDDEIERLENLVKDLKEKKEEQEKKAEDMRDMYVGSAVQIHEATNRNVEHIVESDAKAALTDRQKEMVIKEAVRASLDREEAREETVAAPSFPPMRKDNAPAPPPPREEPPEDPYQTSSLMHSTDEEAMRAQIAREEERQQALRAQAALMNSRQNAHEEENYARRVEPTPIMAPAPNNPRRASKRKGSTVNSRFKKR